MGEVSDPVMDASEMRHRYTSAERDAIIRAARLDAVGDHKRRRRAKRRKVARGLRQAAQVALLPGVGAAAALAERAKRRRKAKRRRQAVRAVAIGQRVAQQRGELPRSNRRAARRRRALNQMRGLMMGPAYPMAYP